jgi:hypothetical protein
MFAENGMLIALKTRKNDQKQIISPCIFAENANPQGKTLLASLGAPLTEVSPKRNI